LRLVSLRRRYSTAPVTHPENLFPLEGRKFFCCCRQNNQQAARSRIEPEKNLALAVRRKIFLGSTAIGGATNGSVLERISGVA